MSAPRRALSYDLRSPQGQGVRACARCANCDREVALGIPDGKRTPQWVRKRFVAEGWEFDEHRSRKCLCPRCVEGRGKAAVAISGKAEGGVVPLKKETTAPDRPRAVKDLNPAERAKVRALLDGQFDDSVGAYLDGYSDQRVGRESGVPWALVAQMREAAYGALTVDTEADALRAEAKAIRGEIAKATQQMAAISDAVAAAETSLARLRDKIESVALTRRS